MTSANELRESKVSIWGLIEILGIVIMVTAIVVGSYGIHMELLTRAARYQAIITTSAVLMATGSLLFTIGDKLRRIHFRRIHS